MEKFEDTLIENTIIRESLMTKEQKLFLRDSLLQEIKSNEDNCLILLETENVALNNFKEEVMSLVNRIYKGFSINYRALSANAKYVNVKYDNQVFSEDTNTYTFNINDFLFSSISFIRNLKIICHVKVLFGHENARTTKVIGELSHGQSKITNKQKVNGIFKKKLDHEKIEIFYYSLNCKMNKDILYGILFHELTHAFQDYIKLKKTNNTDTPFNYANNVTSKYYNSEFGQVEYGQEISEIMYVLFDYNELSAYASQVYGELYAMGSKDRNDYKKTESYKRYYLLKEYISEIYMLSSYSHAWDVAKTSYVTRSHPNGYKNVDNTVFKQKFIDYSVKQLNKYFNKMIKSVDLYIKENIIV